MSEAATRVLGGVERREPGGCGEVREEVTEVNWGPLPLLLFQPAHFLCILGFRVGLKEGVGACIRPDLPQISLLKARLRYKDPGIPDRTPWAASAPSHPLEQHLTFPLEPHP